MKINKFTFPKDIKVFVLHVKKGYENREEHIDRMMAKFGIEFEYFLDGDMSDITQERLDRYFSGDLNKISPTTSCAMKHLLVHEKIVAENIPFALILEDDMFLKRKFNEVFSKSVEQFAEMNPVNQPAMVSYEATHLRLVPRSQREKGKVIYPGPVLQCLGSYLVNTAFSHVLMESVKEKKCSIPIDHYLGNLYDEGVWDLYWSYPVIAEQGSHNGKMKSGIGHKLSKKPQLWVRIKRRLTIIYKYILYFFR